jgi:hypothetical protein
MSVAIACPSCRRQITLHAPEKYAGKIVHCPGCKARMKIPDAPAPLDGARPFPRAADEELPAVELADDAPTQMGPVRHLQAPPPATFELADDSHEEIPPRRHRTGPSRWEAFKLAVNKAALRLVWAVVFLWALLLILSFPRRFNHEATTAIQQAALAGETCVFLIGPYILARALDAIFHVGRS